MALAVVFAAPSFTGATESPLAAAQARVTELVYTVTLPSRWRRRQKGKR